MPAFTAKDVQALRQSTGAGMMDSKRALEATGGDMECASSGSASRAWPARPSGRTARRRKGQSPSPLTAQQRAIVELRCETDFVAKADDFVSLADELA